MPSHERKERPVVSRSKRCPQCNFGFADDTARETHECIEKCPVPSCEYHTKGLIPHECARHVLEHYDTPIRCEFCSVHKTRTFVGAKAFFKHITEAHDSLFGNDNDAVLFPMDTSQSQGVSCPVCEEGCFNADFLSIHLGHCVSNELKRLHTSYIAASGQNLTQNDLHAGTKAQPDGISPSQSFSGDESPSYDSQAKQAVQSHPTIWQCHLCPRQFTRPLNLRAHVNNHSGKRPFACRVCRIRFTRNNDRKTHEMLHSGDHAKAACGMCGREFSRVANRNRHERGCRKKGYSATSPANAAMPSDGQYEGVSGYDLPSPAAGDHKLNMSNATESQEAALVLQTFSGISARHHMDMDELEYRGLYPPL